MVASKMFETIAVYGLRIIVKIKSNERTSE